MLFSLEALEAAHGDALLLHAGAPGTPIVVDGGPPGTWKRSLRPRLEGLHASSHRDAPLELPLVVVSHVDDDHVAGILSMVGHVEESKGGPRLRIRDLWHNSFDDLVKPVVGAGSRSSGAIAASVDDLQRLRGVRSDTALVVASVKQGRDLRNAATRLGIPINRQFKEKPIAATTRRASTVRPLRGVQVTVLGPRQEELDALQSDWASKLETARRDGTLKPAQVDALRADFVDGSVYNLSSLVLLVTCGRRTMLLTGDARGDHLLDVLERSRLKKKGQPFVVDLLKVPHHGSWRNVDDTFFEQIVASHYVISADGKHDNPDEATIESLCRVRKDGGFAVHFTNERDAGGKVLPAIRWLKRRAARSGVEVVLARPRGAVSSVVVDLGKKLDA
jgi:hypothetical protein